jgi:putative phosphoribosyl transferase
MATFKNREDAGRQLAAQLSRFESDSPVVMAILNGGIPVGQPVAFALKRSLLPVPIRSLHVPWDVNTIFGYVTYSGDRHLNQALIGQVRLTPAEVRQIARKRQRSLTKDLEKWSITVPESLQRRTTLIIDDGMHSGWTMFSAVETVKELGAARVIVAVPVTHFRAKRFVGRHCDEIVSLLTEDIALYEIDNYYEEFPAVGDDQVRQLLNAASTSRQPAA